MVSPGMSKRDSVPVDWALLMPVWRSAAQVSKAAVPGSPGVSLAGKQSLYHYQMSAAIVPSVPVPLAASGALVFTNPSETLSR